MRVESVTTQAGFDALQAEWQALLQRSAANTIFLTWEWISSWWASYGRGKELLVLVARDASGTCQGIAPFYAEPYRQMGRTLRRLRFLGDGSADSDYLDFVLARGREAQVLPAFLHRLSALAANWDVAQLNEIPESSPTGAVLANWLARSGWLLRREEVPCAVVALPETWDSYERMLRPRFRTAVRACLRNLEQGVGAVECLSEESRTEEWLNDLFSLHAARWQQRQQPGAFADPAKREFYRRISRAFLNRGWLHFTRWRVHEVVLACQFGFVYQQTYHQLQEGFDSESAHVSPGITLRAAMIRDLIGRGVRAYDFLGGVGRHKADWGATAKLSWRYAFAPRTATGLAYVSLPQALDRGKERVKRVLPKRVLQWWRDARSGGPVGGNLPVEPDSALPEPPGATWREVVAAGLHQSGLLQVARSMARSYELRSDSRRAWPRWHRVSGPKSVILSYHRVGTGGIPLYSSLPSEMFEAQIRFLRKRYRVVSLDELYRELQNPETVEQVVAITFDDGYRDTYTAAFPILQKYQVPATIFLTVSSIESGEVSWYDRVFLAFRVASCDKLDLFLDRPRRFYLPTPAARFRAAQRVVGWMRSLPDRRRRECCAALEKLVPLPPSELTGRMLAWEQIRAMQRAGIAFGSHSLTHPVLSRLAPADLERELLESKQFLEQNLQSPVTDFAFPFGKPDDCGTAARDVLARSGYRLAVTTVQGVNQPGVDPFALRRSSIGEENSPAMFAFNLNRLFFRVEEPGAEADLAAASPAKGDPLRGSERLAS